LEHVPDYKAALSELRRIISDDGVIAITVPIIDTLDATVYEDSAAVTIEEKIEKFGQHDHFRLFGNRFEEILTAAGFQVEVVDGRKLPEKYGLLVGPFDFNDVRCFLCRKNNAEQPKP
jgi:hypothetical protein